VRRQVVDAEEDARPRQLATRPRTPGGALARTTSDGVRAITSCHGHGFVEAMLALELAG
jgi:hypothetical protein